MQRSESIKNIASALAQFQGEVQNPKKTSDNPFFKSRYSSLDIVINTVKPILAKNGLSFIQNASGDGKTISITTMLMHVSGEWIESEPLILVPQKIDNQSMMSSVSYGRRYSLMSLLGIVGEDEDDDGNAASQTKPPKPQNISKATKNTIIRLIQTLAEQKNSDADKLMEFYLNACHVKTLDSLSVDVGNQLIEKISKHLNNTKGDNQ